jgi:hypothetical protein
VLPPPGANLGLSELAVTIRVAFAKALFHVCSNSGLHLVGGELAVAVGIRTGKAFAGPRRELGHFDHTVAIGVEALKPTLGAASRRFCGRCANSRGRLGRQGLLRLTRLVGRRAATKGRQAEREGAKQSHVLEIPWVLGHERLLEIGLRLLGRASVGLSYGLGVTSGAA